ncbi:MAG: SRPBCC family protein [Gemmatimonadota bacterium]
MTTQTTPGADANCVRKVVTVQAPPAVAWRVFTEKMGTWWPLATHKIGKTKAVDAVIEPRAGGRWYERGDDGSTCDWGRVLLWEPPSRLVLSWEISADWHHDPTLKTEVEVRFIADGKNGTRVELEHRRLDLFGARRDEMRGVFNSESGWGSLLGSFARAASA